MVDLFHVVALGTPAVVVLSGGLHMRMGEEKPELQGSQISGEKNPPAGGFPL